MVAQGSHLRSIWSCYGEVLSTNSPSSPPSLLRHRQPAPGKLEASLHSPAGAAVQAYGAPVGVAPGFVWGVWMNEVEQLLTESLLSRWAAPCPALW